MAAEGINLTGAVDGIDGPGIAVYQDQARIRLVMAGVVTDLDIAAVNRLMTVLRDAALDARLCELERDIAAEPCRETDACMCYRCTSPDEGSRHV